MFLNDVKEFLHNINAVRFRLADGEPRQHGNGFFQLDLYNGYRLHVWDPDYPAPQSITTPIHDHRFSFTSLVLYGTQRSVTYDIVESPESIPATHQVYEVTPRIAEDTVLVPTENMVAIRLPITLEIPTGRFYRFPAKAFHETPNDSYVVTLLKKLDVDPGHKARVLCPIGVKPDDNFTRYDLSVDARWQVIEKAIRKVLEQ